MKAYYRLKTDEGHVHHYLSISPSETLGIKQWKHRALWDAETRYIYCEDRMRSNYPEIEGKPWIDLVIEARENRDSLFVEEDAQQ